MHGVSMRRADIETFEVETRADSDGSVPVNELPFWNCYSLYLILGSFAPIFFFFAMFGLNSQEPHEYWAGKVARIVFIIHMIFVVVLIVIIQAIAAKNQEEDY